MERVKTYELNGQLFVEPTTLFLNNPQEDKVPIALRLIINPKEHLAAWHDTMRSHMIIFKRYSLKGNKVTIIDMDDTVWAFTPLTLKLFHNIKDSLAENDREFESDEELRSYYANANF